MNMYTFSEARQKLAGLLDEAARQGEIRIKRRDGQVFIVRPAPPQSSDSPLDIPGVQVELSTGEMVAMIRDMRENRFAGA